MNFFLTTYGGQYMEGDEHLANFMVLFLVVSIVLFLIVGFIIDQLSTKKTTKKATIQTYTVSAGNTNNARKVA